VSRRAVVAVTVVLVLICGRLLVSRGIHPVAAAHYSAQPHVASSPEVIPTALAKETSAPRQPVVPESVDGVNDVDPHKAFGSKSAPIVVEVFSDFQCPACKTLFLTTNRQLMDNYVTTGKVYLIHRDFPLPMHAYSRIAARYARAAAEIGKIELVEKTLFENQEKWEQTGDVDGTIAGVLSAADMAKVRALVKGGTLEPLIDKDYALGQMYRVNQTPTSVFHSKGQTYPYSGVMPYDTLHQFLDQLLSQK
jgi:protein-disulfide isomerase